VSSSYLEATLVAACPSFAEEWGALRRVYPPHVPPSAKDFLGHLRAHVHVLLDGGHVAETQRLFVAIERLLVGADPILEELLEQSFLGPLAADCRDASLDPRLVVPRLGPRSRAVWDRALA
jgi:hypothetical protein